MMPANQNARFAKFSILVSLNMTDEFRIVFILVIGMGWLLKIYFKADGTIDLQHTQAVNEKLMPDDTVEPAFGK